VLFRLLPTRSSIILAPLQELRLEIELMDGRGMKQEGPRLVARCWTDHAFKERLLQVTKDYAGLCF
jgi:hypothetical protein